MIATDHAPHSKEEKSGSFANSLFGIVGLETAFPVLRNFTNSKRPIQTSKDVAGLKLRTMENKAHMAMWRALKADPTPMAFSELFTVL